MHLFLVASLLLLAWHLLLEAMHLFLVASLLLLAWHLLLEAMHLFLVASLLLLAWHLLLEAMHLFLVANLVTTSVALVTTSDALAPCCRLGPKHRAETRRLKAGGHRTLSPIFSYENIPSRSSKQARHRF